MPHPSGPAVETPFRVGRYTLFMRLPLHRRGVAPLECQWSPDVPPRLTPAELAQYRRGRDTLIAEAAAILGGPAIVAEV